MRQLRCQYCHAAPPGPYAPLVRAHHQGRARPWRCAASRYEPWGAGLGRRQRVSVRRWSASQDCYHHPHRRPHEHGRCHNHQCFRMRHTMLPGASAQRGQRVYDARLWWGSHSAPMCFGVAARVCPRHLGRCPRRGAGAGWLRVVSCRGMRLPLGVAAKWAHYRRGICQLR